MFYNLLFTALVGMVIIFCYRWWFYEKKFRRKIQTVLKVKDQYDCVVVGSGVAGCMAARTAALKGHSVLLVEAGDYYKGSKLAVASFLPMSTLGPMCKKIEVAHPAKSDKKCNLAKGVGFGGSTLLDFGIHFPPDSGRHGDITHYPALFGEDSGIFHVSFTHNRNPLAWALVESCVKLGFRKVLPDPAGCNYGNEKSIWPCWLHIDKEGLKANLPETLLEGANVDVLLKSEVTSIVQVDGRATGVVIASGETIMAQNVFICCGAIRTPLLLRSVLLELRIDYWCDALTIPLIYQAQPGLTNDHLNVQTTFNIIRWFVSGGGSLTSTLADTALSFPVPGGSILVELVAAGGFNRQYYQAMNYSFGLGVFKEAFTFHISFFPSDPKFIFKAGEGINEETVKALSAGVEMVRSIIVESPLRHLTTGKEALDLSVFPDADKAKLYFKFLYGKPLKKKVTLQHEREAERIRDEIKEIALSEKYLEQYIRQHVRYLGRSCGSMTEAVDRNFEVPGLKNCFVSDASIIPASTLSSVAGGANSAMSMLWAKHVVEHVLNR